MFFEGKEHKPREGTEIRAPIFSYQMFFEGKEHKPREGTEIFSFSLLLFFQRPGKEHKPREGTEIIPVILRLFVIQAREKNINPVRGRKLDLSRRWHAFLWEKNINPVRGRKQKKLLRKLTRKIGKEHKPREGTETRRFP